MDVVTIVEVMRDWGGACPCACADGFADASIKSIVSIRLGAGLRACACLCDVAGGAG